MGASAGAEARGGVTEEAQGLVFAVVVAEVKVEVEVEVEEVEEGEEEIRPGPEAEGEWVAGFCGGTPRTSTWSAQTTALTPSIAKPMARSRMKTVADSAEAEGVCFLKKKLSFFF